MVIVELIEKKNWDDSHVDENIPRIETAIKLKVSEWLENLSSLASFNLEELVTEIANHVGSLIKETPQDNEDIESKIKKNMDHA